MSGKRLDICSGLSSEDENTTNDNSCDCRARELITTSPASLCSLVASENNIRGLSRRLAAEHNGTSVLTFSSRPPF